jgi:RNA recognition motif-containing protein
MWDHATGRSKGYGFVAMRSRDEAQVAIEKMHGQVRTSRWARRGAKFRARRRVRD